MSEMSERVSDVLLNWGCGTSDECEKIARATIAAMREPTTAMLNAVRVEPAYYAEIRDAYQKVWGDMIDEALR